MRQAILPLVLALAARGGQPAAPAPRPPVQARLTDPQVEGLAKTAIASEDPKVQADTLALLEHYHFKSSLAPQRELSLFVQGMLEDRAGKAVLAAITFHKLEQAWPHSSYLAEGQVIMAEAALEHKRYQEAESRLHKALEADIPAESQRRSQDLLLWCLAEQGRAAEGLAITQALKPLGTAKPSEKGLVGLMEALCAGQQKKDAEAVLRDYHRTYPTGPRTTRMDLDWAKLLGITGDARGAAQGFQSIIQETPAAPEADEARLALATLLTDGRLQPREASGYPAPAELLAALQKASLKDGPAREATLVKLRIALKEKRWQDAIEQVGQYRSLHPSGAQNLLTDQLRTQALRSWTQEVLDRHQSTPLLRYLDGEGIRCLTPAQRLGLTGRLALGGLPEAAQAIVGLAPAGEKPALLKAALEATESAANPRAALELLPGGNESPSENLARAQADLAIHEWPGAGKALAKAPPGPERIRALLAYLNRPPAPGEPETARLREVRSWLARAREKPADREPLAILAADLMVRQGDWRGALALYPSAPQPVNRGWVGLMRATCQVRLGQAGPARDSLKQAGDDPAYRNERLALGQRLGM
jgi:TolA-binding protein